MVKKEHGVSEWIIQREGKPQRIVRIILAELSDAELRSSRDPKCYFRILLDLFPYSSTVDGQTSDLRSVHNALWSYLGQILGHSSIKIDRRQRIAAPASPIDVVAHGVGSLC